MIEERLKKQIEFLLEIDKMKTVFRRNLISDKSRRENDAEHSWHFATMAIVLYEYAASDKVDLLRVLKMALVHDLVEIYAGDTFAYDIKGNEDKKNREFDAADKLFLLLPKEQGEEYRTLWEEFDEMKTPDAMYAAAIDRLQPFYLNYVTDGHTWVLGNVTKKQVYERMDVIKEAAPKLWEFVEIIIEDSVAKGYIKIN